MCPKSNQPLFVGRWNRKLKSNLLQEIHTFRMKSVRIQSDNRTTVCLFKIIHKIYTETLDFGTSVTPNPQADILHRSFSFLSAVCGLRLLLCHLSFALLGCVLCSTILPEYLFTLKSTVLTERVRVRE